MQIQKIFKLLPTALITFLLTACASPTRTTTYSPLLINPLASFPFQKGEASWYGKPFHGRLAANGERYNMYQMTAAHRSLPFGTRVLVKSLATGRTVEVRITDRGPYHGDRIIDLSYAAAEKLGIANSGIDTVLLTYKQ